MTVFGEKISLLSKLLQVCLQTLRTKKFGCSFYICCIEE